MTLTDYSQDELASIVKRHEERKEYVTSYKKKHPPTAQQRRVWNKRHYERRKARSDFNETQHKYQENIKEKRVHHSRHYYYKKTNNILKLKEKYPETYNMYYK